MEKRSAKEELGHAFAEGRAASNFWPDASWWQPAVWDDGIRGMLHEQKNVARVLAWVARAQPVLALALAKTYFPGFEASPVRQALIETARVRTGASNPIARALAYRILGELCADTRAGVHVSKQEGSAFPEFAWLNIPAGHFLSGDRKERRWCDATCFAAYPVTNVQYELFVAAQGYTIERYWTRSGWDWRRTYDITGPLQLQFPFELSNYPRVGISWYEAMAYTRWLNEWYKEHAPSYNIQVRLPGEFELERAIRGDMGNMFAYGNEVDYLVCNGGGTGINSTCAVGIFPEGRSPHGLYDATGNVWVWTISTPRDEAGGDLDSADSRVIRSGSWNYFGDYLRCAFRYSYAPLSRNTMTGIRLALTTSP